MATPWVPDPAEEARVKEVLDSSRFVRWLDAAIDVPPRAWRSSALRGWLEPIAQDFRALPSADQVRWIAWAIIVAIVTHVALVVGFGEPAGWATWTAWLAFLAAALVPALSSQGVVAAWTHRPRWVRRLLSEPER